MDQNQIIRPKTDIDFAEIQLANPILAYYLKTVGLVRPPIVLQAKASFASGGDNAPVQASLDTRNFCYDFWVTNVSYTVRRPNAFAGNVFKAESDVFNVVNPNIDVQVVVRQPNVDTVMALNRTPIEGVFQPIPVADWNGCCIYKHFVIPASCGSVDFTFFLNRALEEDEVGLEVVVMFYGRYIDPCFGRITMKEALVGLGYPGADRIRGGLL